MTFTRITQVPQMALCRMFCRHHVTLAGLAIGRPCRAPFAKDGDND